MLTAYYIARYRSYKISLRWNYHRVLKVVFFFLLSRDCLYLDKQHHHSSYHRFKINFFTIIFLYFRPATSYNSKYTLRYCLTLLGYVSNRSDLCISVYLFFLPQYCIADSYMYFIIKNSVIYVVFREKVTLALSV